MQRILKADRRTAVGVLETRKKTGLKSIRERLLMFVTRLAIMTGQKSLGYDWFRALSACSSASEFNTTLSSLLRLSPWITADIARQSIVPQIFSKVIEVAIPIVALLKHEPTHVLEGRDYCYEGNLRVLS